MASSQNRTNQTDLSQPLALVLFSYQFSTLIAAGVSLVRALRSLSDITHPYGDAARDLQMRLERGETLSDAMALRPDLFSNFYIRMVHAGEVGGILEETLRRAADLMTKEWHLVFRPGTQDPLFLLNPSSAPLPGDWANLSAYQRTVTLILFCETLGQLLISGVPILQSLDIVTHLLPTQQRGGLAKARAAIKRGEPIVPSLEQIGIFPPFALALIDQGEFAGSLDTTLHMAAEIFEHELECRLMAAGEL